MAGNLIKHVNEIPAVTSSSIGAQFLAGTTGTLIIGRFAGVGPIKVVRPEKDILVYGALVAGLLASAIGVRGKYQYSNTVHGPLVSRMSHRRQSKL